MTFAMLSLKMTLEEEFGLGASRPSLYEIALQRREVHWRRLRRKSGSRSCWPASPQLRPKMRSGSQVQHCHPLLTAITQLGSCDAAHNHKKLY